MAWSSMHSYEVIVVGLGCAGVTAATTLVKAGKKVLALEAMDRVGGRIRTVPFGDGVVEVGAEWIHGTVNSRIYSTALENNITVVPQDITFNVFKSDGTPADSELLNNLVDFAFEKVGKPPMEFTGGLGEFITSRLMEYVKVKYPDLMNDQAFLTEFLELMNLYINNHESSNDWNDVSAQSRYTELEGHQHMSWHRHGYKTFFELMLNTYNNGPGLPNLDIKLNTEVTQIMWPKDGADVRVICADGSTYTSRHVIVTVSLGVLKERYKILFNPGLPHEKIEAIENTSIGVMDKIIFQFDRPWWPKQGTFFGFFWNTEDKKEVPTEDYWITRIFAASNPMGSRNALTMWTSGDVGKMLETLPEDTVKRKCMELLRKFMGKTCEIPEPIGMIRSTWYSNPFTRGSYSYDNRLTIQNPNARTLLAEPLRDTLGVPRVLFAGEATDLIHFSAAHGAVDSGYREAMRIIGNSKL
ncbi:protein anon-37Cs-like isoform X1 [Pieris rapae]|uniref:protein anon-37Cs-like isoform X1 n=1 Tax=Pieris rapae TaxID=64459 RepID=UPI001E27CF47|nr:protein anon-37Cs-like isoform X1 [Pieris rapae]